ncbi:MAG: hypothetical protein MI922_11730, partial [Bacteroidales bacterium]|nr:hypothetical protein [Bacteroidales bacterium]
KTIPKEVLGVRKYHWTKLNKREEKEEKFYSYYSSEQFLVSIVIVYFIIMSYAMIIAPLLNPCITSKEIDLIYGVEKQHLKLVFIGILGFLYFAGRYIFRIGEFKDGTPGIDIKENIPLVFALACIIVHQIFIVVLHGSQEMDIGMFIGILMLDVSLLVIGNIIIYSIHREFNSMNPLVKLLNA